MAADGGAMEKLNKQLKAINRELLRSAEPDALENKWPEAAFQSTFDERWGAWFKDHGVHGVTFADEYLALLAGRHKAYADVAPPPPHTFPYRFIEENGCVVPLVLPRSRFRNRLIEVFSTRQLLSVCDLCVHREARWGDLCVAADEFWARRARNGKSRARAGRPAVVMVDIMIYPLYATTVHRLLRNVPHVLVIVDEDCSFTRHMFDAIDSDNLVAVHAQNLEFAHERCHALPLGVGRTVTRSARYNSPPWEELGLSIDEVLRAVNLADVDAKAPSIYINCARSSNRVALLDALQSRADDASNESDAGAPFVVFAPYKQNASGRYSREDFRDYLLEMSRYRFTLCPPGNGFDCFRVWEALLVGSVPIVPESPFWDGFPSDMPLLRCQDMVAELTPARCEEEWTSRLRDQMATFDRTVLSTSYWERSVLKSLDA